jgi:protease PrsW
MISLSTLGLSLLFGFGPPLIWLLLWLQEDRDHPEPRSAILKTFMLGGAGVIIAIILEGLLQNVMQSMPLLLLSWAFIEELIKLGAVLFALYVFNAPIDEPVDWLIYMITAALGFAAVENTFFLVEPFSDWFIIEGLMVSNLRFMGATLLHVVASATHGAALGLCFYLGKKMKHRYYLLGFASAVIVHTIFNVALINGNESMLSTIIVFAGVWLLLLPIILIFEKVKTMRRQNF